MSQNKDDIVAGRRLGVERTCKVLQVAPSTYFAANGRPASARQIRDAEIAPRLLELWESRYSVQGVRKFWKAARRSRIEIGGDQVARLMKIREIEGVRREKRFKTTKPDPKMPRHPDLVNRVFSADAQNQLWVTDLTFVPPWQGIAYVCFIIDAYSRAIVGLRCVSSMKTETALDAIEMARWSREKYLPELRCHSDAGSQVTSIRYGERLAEVGATPSIGSVGESYDNALAETVNGQGRAGARARETRAVEDHRRSRARDAGWVHWHDTKRLHGYLGDVPPFEYEEFFYAAVASAKELVEIK